MKKRAISLLLCFAMLFSMTGNIFATDVETGHTHNQDGWSCTENPGETTLSCTETEHSHSGDCYSTPEAPEVPEAPEATEPSGEGESTGEGSGEVQAVATLDLSPVLTCTETEHSHGADCSVTSESTWECTAPAEAPVNKAPAALQGNGAQTNPVKVAQENYLIDKEVLVQVNGGEETLTLAQFEMQYKGKAGYDEALAAIKNEVFYFIGYDAGSNYAPDEFVSNSMPGVITRMEINGAVKGEGTFAIDWSNINTLPIASPNYRVFACEVQGNSPNWIYDSKVIVAQVNEDGTVLFQNDAANGYTTEPKFTNIYNATITDEPATTLPTVSVEKKVTGDTVAEGTMPTFQFQVTKEGEKEVLATAEIKGIGTADFVWNNGVTVDTDPQIVYEISEVAGNDKGWTYSTEKVSFVFPGGKDGQDGKVKYKYADEQKYSEGVRAITNKYEAPLVYTGLTGEKAVKADDANFDMNSITMPTFDFTVSYYDAEAKQTVFVANASREGAGQFAFTWDKAALKKDGTTVYTMAEKKGSADKWSYSTQRYYFVINEDGTVQFKSSNGQTDVVAPKLVFTNTYITKTADMFWVNTVIKNDKTPWDSGEEQFKLIANFNMNSSVCADGEYTYKINGVEQSDKIKNGTEVLLKKNDRIDVCGLPIGASVVGIADRMVNGEYQNYRHENSTITIKASKDGNPQEAKFLFERRGTVQLKNLSKETVEVDFTMDKSANDGFLYALLPGTDGGGIYTANNNANYAGKFNLLAGATVILYNAPVVNVENSYSLTGTDGQKLQYSFNGGEQLETSNFTWQNGLTNEVFDHTIAFYDPKVIIPPTLKNLNVFKQVVDASAGKTYTESRFDFTLTNKDEAGNVIATAKAMAIVPKNAAEPVELQLANDVKTLADGNYIVTEDTLGSAYSANTQQFKVIVENNAVIGTMVWDATANNWVATEKAVFTNTYNGQTGGVDPGEPDDDRDPPEENIDDNRTPTTTPPTTTPPVEEEEIIDTAPPLTEAPLEEDLGEEEVPLTNLPKTGGLDMTVGLLGLFTVGSGMVLVRKKDENEGKKKIDTTGSDQ